MAPGWLAKFKAGWTNLTGPFLSNFFEMLIDQNEKQHAELSEWPGPALAYYNCYLLLLLLSIKMII